MLTTALVILGIIVALVVGAAAGAAYLIGKIITSFIGLKR